MSLAGSEPANPASEQSQTHALDRTATGIGNFIYIRIYLRSTLYLGALSFASFR
jgi:hypothetical protein